MFAIMLANFRLSSVFNTLTDRGSFV